MKRNDVVSLAAAIVILLALVVAWMTNASGALGAALSGVMTGAALVAQGADSKGIMALHILWLLSLGVTYLSGVYYYRK